MALTEQSILDALAAVAAPDGTPLPKSGVLSPIVITGGKVFLSLTVPAADTKLWDPVRVRAEAAIKAVPGVAGALVALTAEREAGMEAPRPTEGPSAVVAKPAASAPRRVPHSPHGSPMARQAPIAGVDKIIAVASGKGGVGKSTTALNLALGLRALGLSVGILDADIYGPSMPRLTGIHEKPQVRDGKVMIPPERFGLKVMSIGFLVSEETPMIWRGPMVMSAITQMLREVDWGKLDVLVVDMPPGTGDAQLTLAQNVPLSGAVIVSTPQDLALIDARRGIAMFQRVNVPVLGIVENMSYFECPHCGTRSDIFGHGGAAHEAEKLNVPFLGAVPLHMTIRESSDAGEPVVATNAQGSFAAHYMQIAENVRAALTQAKS